MIAASYRRAFSNSSKFGKSRINHKITKEAADNSLFKHAMKTFITYAIPLGVFGAFSFYDSSNSSSDNVKEESIGSLLRRAMRGEKVWEKFIPRKELISVTRLNDQFANYVYCLDKLDNPVAAESRIRNSEMLMKLREKVLYSFCLNATTDSVLLGPCKDCISNEPVKTEYIA